MRAFWEFLHSPRSALSFTTYYSLLCLLLLAGCVAGFFIARELRIRRKKDVFWTAKERAIAAISTIAERASMMIFGAILGIFAGIGYRDHQLSINTPEYDGVFVMSQQSDRRYGMLIPGYSKIWDFEFCHALKMPSKIIDIKYEQRFGCKQVYGVGFVKPHKENEDAQLQIR